VGSEGPWALSSPSTARLENVRGSMKENRSSEGLRLQKFWGSCQIAFRAVVWCNPCKYNLRKIAGCDVFWGVKEPKNRRTNGQTSRRTIRWIDTLKKGDGKIGGRGYVHPTGHRGPGTGGRVGLWSGRNPATGSLGASRPADATGGPAAVSWPQTPLKAASHWLMERTHSFPTSGKSGEGFWTHV